MMRPVSDVAVYLCRDAIDFRKGARSLAVLVESQFQRDPFGAGLFVFRDRRCRSMKILYWECNGFCLWQKRLEQDRFCWPKRDEKTVLTLTTQELLWLLEGYDITQMKPHKTLCFSSIL